MSASIRPANLADADAVAVFLNRYMNPRIPVTRWRNLFTFPWAVPREATDFGRVAVSDGEVVGFISRIYSQRLIDGERHLVANISSWYQRKDHRRGNLGLRLYRELLQDRGPATYTVLSIARRTYPLYDRWGFSVLDESRWLWRRQSAPGRDVEIVTDVALIDRAVDSEQRRMLRDHRGFELWPVLVSTPDGDCLAVLTAKHKGEDELFLDVLHVSRPEILMRYGGAIANRLLPEGKAVLAADARFLPGPPIGAECVPIAIPRRYLSDGLEPGALDLMYSETVLLNLKLS